MENRCRPRSILASASSDADLAMNTEASATEAPAGRRPSLRRIHNVDGIKCTEVTINLEVVGPVTVLEATAESQEELVRMALDEDAPVHLNQHTLKSGDPYGAVLWPAASAIANYILTTTFPQSQDHRSPLFPLRGMSILELGTGTGLVSIAAYLGGASRVIATDYEEIPLRLLRYASSKLNQISAGEGEGQNPVNTAYLDMCDYVTPLPMADLVVAADIMYEPKTGRAMARRASEALKRGSRVVIGDSPGRPGRPAFIEELRRLLPGIKAEFVDTVGMTCTGDRHELICGKGSESVSETPKRLPVAVMDLNPSTCLPFE